MPFVISLHSTTVHFSSPCLSHSVLIVAKAAWRAEERLEKLLGETEHTKVARYTFSIAVAAMYRRGGIIASWIPSIYILSQNVSHCLWKQCQQPRNKCSLFVNQRCYLYWMQQSIYVVRPAAINLCAFVKCGQGANLFYFRKTKWNLSFYEQDHGIKAIKCHVRTINIFFYLPLKCV